MIDEYVDYVLSDLRSRTGIDFSNKFFLELMPETLQFKIRKASQILKTLRSLKSMINATDKKGLFNFHRSEKIKETEEYRFEYEKLEKEYSSLIDQIAKELSSYLQK